MKYNIHITDKAIGDIERSANYIEQVLKNPIAADNLLEKTASVINSLTDMPERNRVVDDPVLSSWNIRNIIIGNYIALYKIMDDTVYIIRFLHSRQNWFSILREDLSSNNP